jgi:chemotaxis protein MotB
MPDEKLARVTGLASSNLLDQQNPLSPINRRISIIVMTREAEERLMGSGRTPISTGVEPRDVEASPTPKQ